MVFVLLILVAYNWTNDTVPADRAAAQDVHALCHISDSPTVDSRDIPFTADAELGSIGLNAYQYADSRSLRTSFNAHTLALKNVTRNISNRQAILSKHWEKFCDSSILSVSHPVSEYYVFALRHIII